MIRPLFAFAVLPGLTMLACVPSSTDVARARAPTDLACPAASLDERELGHDTVEISGCGQRAVYTCPRSGRYQRVCIREAAR